MGSLSERNRSPWVATTPEQRYQPLPGNITVDVAIIGGGITGLTTALLLRQAGLDVALLEADRIASGTTGYTTAKVTSLHGLTYARLLHELGERRARIYGEANQAGLEQIAAFVESYGIDCDFERMLAFTYTEDLARVEEIRSEFEAAKQLGLPATYTEATDLPFAVRAAVRFDAQAMFHPRKYCLGLADALTAAGGKIFDGTRVLGVKERGLVEVDTALGTVKAEQVVVATQIPFFLRGLFSARSEASRSYAIAGPAGVPVPRGMYISAEHPTRSIRPLTVGGETLVLLGGEGHKVGHDRDTRRRYQALEQWGQERFNLQSVTYRWSAQDYIPVDGVPYIGRATALSRRTYVATGFRKWGLTTGTAAARMIADLILERPNPWLELFDATRIEPKRSAKGFAELNLDVAGHFIGDRLAMREASPVVELAKGEAGIVDIDGTKAAAYRDEGGRVHAVSPYCTHLGCVVKWNSAETTWDCPCHGSRFSYDGALLQGPAVKDLERRTVE